MPLRFSIISLLLCCLSSVAYSQIVDDSTKQIYGPRSARYRLQHDLFWNIDTLYRIDTSVNNLHLNDDYSRRNGVIYKDLGNLGTANEPLFFALPTQIGRRLGFNAFNVFAFNEDRVKFYNTYSTFSSIQYLQGGNGRQEIDVEAAQNINNRLNIAIRYRRLTSWKQIGTPTSEEKEADHNALGVSASYFSKDTRYQLMASFSAMNHRQAETGGIQPTSADTVDGKLNKNNLFNYEQEPGQLSVNASSRDIRQSINLYHQYQIAKGGGFIIFHEFNNSLQKNYFYETDTALNTNFYREFFPSTRALAKGKVLFVEHQFYEISNKIGLKTKLSWAQLAVWAKRRDFNYWATNDSYNSYTSENYLGAAIRFDPFKNVSLDALGEYIVGHDYQLKGKLTTGSLYASVQLLNYSPTINQLQFSTPILNWDNSFKNINAQSVELGLNTILGKQTIKASIELTRLGNYIYYGFDAKPIQIGNSVTNTIIKVQPIFRIGKLVFNNDLRIASSSDDNAIRMPQLFAWLRWYYEGSLFNKAADVCIGFDFRIQSDYYGNRYLPITEQFISQPKDSRGFMINAYPALQPYVNVRIKRASVFLEGVNVLQGLTGAGYFSTPYYPASKRLFSFGIRWYFFD